MTPLAIKHFPNQKYIFVFLIPSTSISNSSANHINSIFKIITNSSFFFTPITTLSQLSIFSHLDQGRFSSGTYGVILHHPLSINHHQHKYDQTLQMLFHGSLGENNPYTSAYKYYVMCPQCVSSVSFLLKPQ